MLICKPIKNRNSHLFSHDHTSSSKMTSMENGSRNYQYKRTWAIWHRLQGQMVVSSMLSLKRWQPALCSSEAGGQATSLITRKAGHISHELRALGKDVGSRMLVASLGVIDSR